MSNVRLRAALVASGVRTVEVAERVQVDPKTVERWITLGRMPYRTHRWTVAKLLGVDSGYLWPETQDEKQFRVVMDRERWFSVVMGDTFKVDARTTEKLARRVPLPAQVAEGLAFRLEARGVAGGVRRSREGDPGRD